MKTTLKLLSLALCLIMCLTLLPFFKTEAQASTKLPSNIISAEESATVPFEASSYDSNKVFQTMLRRTDYYCGLIDGLMQQATQIAIFNFQRDYGLEVTGLADTATWDKLTEMTGWDGNIPVAQFNIPWYIFTPKEMTDGLPLIVYLHGDSAVGKAAEVQACGIVKQAKAIYGDEQPFVLLTPCTHAPSWISESITPTLKGIIDLVAQIFNCSDIIITGHSRGGIGTWNAVDKYPGFFTKAVPVSGMPLSVEPSNFKNTTVWAFVGAGKSDYFVYGDLMADFVDSLQQEGVDAKLTVMEGKEHGHMSLAPYTKELFEWMIEKDEEEIKPPDKSATNHRR